MALPLQELVSVSQDETSPDSILLREETSLCKEETSPPREERLSTQDYVAIVSVAAKSLVERNIPVVEYGEQIQWRYGDPEVLMVSIRELFCHWLVGSLGIPNVVNSSALEWAVPDERLSLASEILSDLGVRYISIRCHLSALSFRTPARYMVSLLRHLLNHPLGDSFRYRVTDDLMSFICFYILRQKPLDTNHGGCEEDESEEDYQNRIGEALKEMKTWDWGPGGIHYFSIAEPVLRDCRSVDRLLYVGRVPARSETI